MNSSVKLPTPSESGVGTLPHPTQTAATSLTFFTSGRFMRDKYFLVAAGTVLSTVVIFGLYKWISGRTRRPSETKVPPLKDGQSPESRAKDYIKSELKRLQNIKLTEEEEGYGYLHKRDFFDLLAVVQLKTKLKIQKEVARNQKERVRLLEAAMSQAKHEDAMHYYVMYINKTMEIMQRECDQYEDQFQKILSLINVAYETWDASRELYIQGGQEPIYTEEETPQGVDNYSIESIERRVYAFLPQPNLPKSLTAQMTKQIMLDINHRGSQLYKKYMKEHVLEQCNPEYEPLLLESLSFDLTLVEYNYNESVVRFANHKYGLHKDPEIQEQLEEYLSS